MKKTRRLRRRTLTNRARQTRLLRGERLESRELLAADVPLTASAYHNMAFPADVNVDGQLSPFDALVGINQLNAHGPQYLEARGASGVEGEGGLMLDVNGDGAHTPADILRTINLLNAEGEPGPVINVSVRIFERPANYPFFDNDSNPNTAPLRVQATNEISTIGVGQDFVVKLIVEDIRSMANRDGVFSAYYDINFDDPALASLVTNLPFVRHPQASNTPTPYLHNAPYGQGARPTGSNTGFIDTDGDSVPDQIDVIGSFAGSLSPVGAGEFVLVEWVMTASATGTLTITPEATTEPDDPNDAGESTAFDSGLYNQDLPVCPSVAACEGEMVFNSDSITIVQDVTAVPDTRSTPEDTAITVDVLANDIVTTPAGAEPALVSFTQPSGAVVTRLDMGTATQTDDVLRVTPNANFNGDVVFNYTISNGAGATSTTSVTVTVQPVNDAPVNTVPGARTTNEDTPLTINGLSVADVDADAGTGLSVMLAVSSGTLTANATGGTVTGQGTSSVTITGTVAQVNAGLSGLIYTPNANYNGPDTLTITTNDLGNTGGTVANPGANNPLSDTDTVGITVVAQNDAPVNILPAGPVSVFNTDTLTFTNRSLQTSDVDAGTVSVSLSVSLGTLTLSTTSGLTVTGNNTASVTLQGPLASVNNALNGLVYDPIDGTIDEDTLTMTTSDLGNSGAGGVLTDTDTLTITITPPEVPFAASNSFDVEEDSGATTLDILGNDLAPPAENGTPNTLAITLINGQSVTVGQQLTTSNGGTITFNGGDVSYQPAPNFFGIDSFTYTIESSPVVGDGPSTGNVTVNVLAINDGPVNTVPGAQSVDEDGSLSFTGGATVSVADIDAGAAGVMVDLTVASGRLVVATAGGAAVVGNNSASVKVTGTVAQVNTALAGLTYTPNANFNGNDTLTVLTDDLGNTGGTVGQPTLDTRLTDSDTVAITVNAINDAPTISVPGFQEAITDFDNVLSAAEGNAIQIADVDAGGDDVQVTLTFDGTLTLSSSAGLTSVSGNGTGTVTIVGSVNAINAALASGVVYRTSTSGDKVITATVNDLGNNGGIPGNPGANNPLEASGEIDIEVLDFVPSFIGGFVFVDGDRDANLDAGELRLEGVRVTLTGTTFRNDPVMAEAFTDRDGHFLFSDLQPGNYTLEQHQPANLVDGRESFEQPLVAVRNDAATVNIPVSGGVNSRANNFGEGSFTTPFVDLADLLVSSYLRSGIVMSHNADGDWASFTGPGNAWAGYSNPRIDLAAGTLTVTDASGQDRVVNLDAADPQVEDGTYRDRIRVRSNGTGEAMRLIGSASDFGLGGGGEGEGEASAAQYAAAVDVLFGSDE